MHNGILINNFWPVTEQNKRSELLDSDLGWKKDMAILPGSNDTKDIFDFWVGNMEFSLGLFYAEENIFFFLWSDYKEIFILPKKSDWDGKYIFESCIIDEQTVYDLDPIFGSNDLGTLWKEFRFKGKDLRYIIDHSVVVTTH